MIEIRDGVQRLIDENAEMSSQLEGMTDARRGEFIHAFLLSAFEDEDAYLQTAEQVAINVDMAYFAVAIPPMN